MSALRSFRFRFRCFSSSHRFLSNFPRFASIRSLSSTSNSSTHKNHNHIQNSKIKSNNPVQSNPSPSSSSSSPLRCNYGIRSPPLSSTVILDRPFPLFRSNISLNSVEINYSRIGNSNGPIVYIMPSMSHSSNVASDQSGWWSSMVGFGSQFGVDLNCFQVISASPLGAPYGSTSPLSINPVTGIPYRSSFPVITPADQAELHNRLLEYLKIDKVFAVIGASMGGMQALQFSLLHPDKFDRLAVLCTTARTSPSTVALRAVQRLAVEIDAKYSGGHYDPFDGPVSGMKVARSMGTICYRSREEFDGRFDWRADPQTHKFSVERYLDHSANSFALNYDPNCYLTLSRCMDLMDFTYDFNDSYVNACSRIPTEKEFLFLPVSQDALIPSHELNELAQELGNRGCRVHIEPLQSLFGHDFFLKEYDQIAPRIAEFLSRGEKTVSGVEKVRNYVSGLDNQ